MTTTSGFPQEFEYASITGKVDITPRGRMFPWSEFVSALQKPTVRSDKDGPAFIPAHFRESRRVDECVEYLTALVLDLDGKPQSMTLEQIAKLLDGCTFVAHTTFSSTPEKLRWRVVIPYSRPATVAEHQRAYDRMQQVFEGAIDPACKNPSHFFYGPACRPGMAPHFQCFSNEGVALDPSQFATAGEVQAHPSSGITISVNELRVTEDIKQLIREGKPKGQRSEAIFAAIRAMVKTGHTDAEIAVMLMDPANKLSEKPLELGRAWVQTEIKRIHNKLGAELPAAKLRCTDYGNAQRLVRAADNRFRYCPEVKRWLVWDGFRWVWDEDGAIDRLAKKTARNILFEASQETDDHHRDALRKWSSWSESVRGIHAMIELAKTEPGISLNASQLDANPMLIGVINGTVNLRTGQLRPAKLDDYMTKRGLVKYDPDAKCPKWEKFIDEIFGSDVDLVAYVRRVVGYLSTGLTNEQCMFVLHGHGANGKTVFTETINQLLGDYALTIPPETLKVRKHDGGATPDLARLRGSRLALAAESEEGSVLAAGFIKSATGEETISCRELYGKPFEFQPSFKLILTTNHKPIIKDDGHGMWRRMQLIQFAVTFPKERQNPNLKAELLAELPGILNWAIAGCLEWQEKRLNPPEAVVKATDGYRSDMDLIGGWITDCCLVDDPQALTTFADLYFSYDNWNDDNGGYKLSKQAFGRKLEDRGFAVDRNGKGDKCRRGLKLAGPVFVKF